MTTNILLTLIVVLLLARVILQVRDGKRVVEKEYASTAECKRAVVYAPTLEELGFQLCDGWSYCDYELVSIVQDKDGDWYAFLQRKKIKNYMEE